MAADVAAKYKEANAVIAELRQKDRGGDWTTYQAMLDDAIELARDGLQNSYKMMNHVKQITKEAAARQ